MVNKYKIKKMRIQLSDYYFLPLHINLKTLTVTARKDDLNFMMKNLIK